MLKNFLHIINMVVFVCVITFCTALQGGTMENIIYNQNKKMESEANTSLYVKELFFQSGLYILKPNENNEIEKRLKCCANIKQLTAIEVM